MKRMYLSEDDIYVRAIRAADAAGVDLSDPVFVDYDDSNDPLFVFTGVTPYTREPLPADNAERGRGKRPKK